MRGLVVLAIVANMMLFVTDGITSFGFPSWFFYPWGVSAMIGIGIYFQKFTEEPRITVFYYEWLVFNIVLFLAWLSDTNRAFPWFFVVLIVTAIPLVILYMRDVYNEFRWWMYIIVALNMLNLMVFLIWGFVPSTFPWFLIIWFVLEGVSVFLWYRFKSDGGYDVFTSGSAPAPQAGTPAAFSQPSGSRGPNQYDQL